MKMTEKDFREMMVSERIAMIIKRELKEGREAFEEGEKTIKGLEPETRKVIEAYLEVLASDDADIQEAAYLGGVWDGIYLMAKIFRIVWEREEQEGRQ